MASRSSSLLLALLLVAAHDALGARPLARSEEQWSRFRGPNGGGVAATDAPWPVVFDAEHALAWKVPLPEGHSSPIVWDERLFVTGFVDGELETLAIDRETGEVIWGRRVSGTGRERLHDVNSPASSTPVTDGERVFVYFGTLGLVCYDVEGEELWRRERPIPKNTFGSAASPIVAGDALVLVCDANDQATIEAFDRESGETLWKTDRGVESSGWSTPVVLSREGAEEVISLGAWWLKAYDLADGTERWAIPGLTDEPIVTPALGEGLVFVSSYNMNTNPEVIGLPEFGELLAECDADGSGDLTLEEASTNESVLSRADADGEGDHPLRIFFGFLDADKDGVLTEEEWARIFDWLGSFEHANALVAVRPGDGDAPAEIAWQHNQGVPECPSPLYYRGRIYLVKNGGMVTCLDARTGELRYRGRLDSRGPCYASPVAAGGNVYSASARGVVTVFAAGDRLEVLARNDLGERIMATPALAAGRIYVRTEAHLWGLRRGRVAASGRERPSLEIGGGSRVRTRRAPRVAIALPKRRPRAEGRRP